MGSAFNLKTYSFLNNKKLKRMSNKPSFKSNKSKEIICYCFSYTKEDIEKDLKLNGKSTILEYIKKANY